MKNKETIIQFLKFGTIGFFNTVLTWTITNGGYYIFNVDKQICNVISFIITVFISFLLNRKFVFNQNDKETGFIKPLLKVYASYSVTGLFLNGILIFIESDCLKIPLYIATIMNIFINVPINFLLNKFWAYKK